MPAQPAWFHRLDEILGALRSMTSPHLDRAAVEKLFRVRQRRARQIMAGLEGLRVGNAAAVSREALIARLERTADGGVFQWEGNRRARLVEALDLARRQLAAQHVRIPAAADVRERLLEDLSAGIALRPGELRITFNGAMDLAAKLLELSQAMANDWPAFRRTVEENHPQGAAH